ncbi:MAG TPA: hypothetical protein VJ461_05825 [Candidatus Nanoarchaeia archaeon]|nr:hypothetical protein [Candidatus Nanoarchaeia archaeon]
MKLIQISLLLVFLLVLLTSCSKEPAKYVCSNGQTVSDPSLCPQPTPEPEKTAYYCDDGREVDNPILCSQETVEKNEISISRLDIGPGPGPAPCSNIEKITNDTYIGFCDISRELNYLAFTFTVVNTGNTLLRDVFCDSSCEQYIGKIIQRGWSGMAGPTTACITDSPNLGSTTRIVLMKTQEYCGGSYTIKFTDFPTEVKIGRYLCNLTCYSNITPTRDSKELIFTAKFVD